MTKLVKGARILLKRSDVAGVIPTVPAVEDHTLGWLETDIYKGEFFLNMADYKLWTRTNTGITEIPVIDPISGKIRVSDLPSSILGGVKYQGTWNASTGNPPTTIPSNGWYYIINISGTTDLDGINEWQVGDWAIFCGELSSGGTWGKVDNSNNLTSTEISYTNPSYPLYTNVQKALDGLLYVTPVITATINTPSGGVIEIGSTITTVGVGWSTNKIMSSVTITGTGSPTTDYAPATSGVISITGLSLTTDTTYTMHCTDLESATDTGSANVSFRYSRYWGVGTLTSLSDSQINALTNELSTSRVKTITYVCANEYFYYIYPVTWGTSTFTIGGVENVPTVSTITHINSSGNSASYYFYRSVNLLTGTITVVIT
jgi:hypothetical protein